MSTTYPSDLSDAEWACAQRCLPLMSKRGRSRTHPLRRILDAIFYLVRTGCAWRYLPSDFPPWQTVFYDFRRFRLKGLWHLLCSALHYA
jgi:putative transposase